MSFDSSPPEPSSAGENPSSQPSHDGLRTLFWGLAFLLLLVLAFLIKGQPGSDRNLSVEHLEYWFFDTAGASAGLMLLVALWAAWRRLPGLVAISTPSPHWKSASFFASSCVIIFVWSKLADAPDLRLIALAALLATMAARMAGLSGAARLGIPAAILMLSLPLPYPLSNEILWSMQNWSAQGTAALVGLIGIDIEQSGAHLSRGDVHFLVIEGCSGLRSVLTLTLVAFVVSELLDLPRKKAGWLVLSAPPLALLLNILRIALVILMSSGEDRSIDETHLSQGLLVLAVGSVLIFALGHSLESSVNSASPGDHDPRIDWSRVPLREGVIFLAFLLLLNSSIEPLPFSETPPPSGARSFPPEGNGWSSETLELDYPFLGVTPRGFIERREYKRAIPVDRLGERPIEMLIAESNPWRPRQTPQSSKLVLPGRRWRIVSTEEEFNYTLGHPVSVSVVEEPHQRALVYSWTSNAHGFWRDSLRSLLAIERGPFAREDRVVMTHIATIIGDEKEARDHAKQMLDGFVLDFREPIRAL